VKGLAGRGTTVLPATQYLEEAEQLADRIAILHQGRIIVNGTSPSSSSCCRPRRSSTTRSSLSRRVFFAVVGDSGEDDKHSDADESSTDPQTSSNRE
jgi:ABC-2 type transport system ATP-binding protein